MPKIDGVDHKVTQASNTQTQGVMTILRNKEMIKELYEQNEKLLIDLYREGGDKCFSYMNKEGVRMTYRVGKPKGKFVSYQDLDFTHHSKTTKNDLSQLPL